MKLLGEEVLPPCTVKVGKEVTILRFIVAFIIVVYSGRVKFIIIFSQKYTSSKHSNFASICYV